MRSAIIQLPPVLLLASLLAGYTPAAADALRIGSATAGPGQTVALSLILENTVPVRGLQFNLSLPADRGIAFSGVEPIGRAVGWNAGSSGSGTELLILLFSVGGTSLAPGNEAVLSLSFSVAASAPVGVAALSLTQVTVSDENLYPIPGVLIGDGSITVASDQPPPPNQPPTAAFTLAPRNGKAPLAVTFDAAASRDPDGSIAAYAWEFGDGQGGSGITVVHTYPDPGRFLVRLTVTDNSGAGAVATDSVLVTANRPPVALFSFTPDSGQAPLTVRFDAAASQDPDGTIAGYRWDFGDGAGGSGIAPTHTYPDSGSFLPRLTVTDSDGDSSFFAVDTITVTATRLLAAFTATPGSGTVPLTVSFDAAASRAFPDSIAGFAWNFGDGGTGSGPTAGHTFAAAGNYTVRLTVTSSRGDSAAVTRPIFAYAPGDYRRGDVNRDTRTDIFDLLELLGILSGSRPTLLAQAVEQFPRGDVNRDTRTDIFDLLELLGILGGRRPE